MIDALPASQIKPDALNFFAMMKPMFAGMLGQFGQGMEFIIYPSKQDQDLILDPRREGAFTLKLYGHPFKWRLPLNALIPAKVDPKSGEEFPGSYRFNPFTGEKLVTKS